MSKGHDSRDRKFKTPKQRNHITSLRSTIIMPIKPIIISTRGPRGGRGRRGGSRIAGFSNGSSGVGRGGGRKRTRFDNVPEPDPSMDNEPDLEAEGFKEEHVLLRVPTTLAPKLDALAGTKDAQKIGLMFSDPRKGKLNLEGKDYKLKLVDLPCVIESHKTFQNKQLLKVADISQMLIVDDPKLAPSKPLKKRAPHIWPDGITPPMKNVRKRRFRKRVSKQTIEIVENEMERLLQADLDASEIVLEYRDKRESLEFDSDEGEANANGEIVVDDATPSENQLASTQNVGPNAITLDSAENDDGFDFFEDLEREMEVKGVDTEGNDEDDDDDDSDDSDDEDDEEDEDEDEETRMRRNVLLDTIKDLEGRLNYQRSQLNTVNNPIIRGRVEDKIRLLQNDLDANQAQLDEL